MPVQRSVLQRALFAWLIAAAVVVAGERGVKAADPPDRCVPSPAAVAAPKSKPANSVKPAAKANAETVLPADVEQIPIEIAEGADPNVAWDKYFAANEPHPAAVRDAARRLMDKKQYAHVIAMLKAALRHGDAQSWMYEALVIAMQADDRPKEDIERVVLSAVDFAQNAEDLLCIGVFMTRAGLDERALQVFRQVAAIEPARHEAYLHGLQVAKRLGDLEALKSLSLALVGQVWPKNQVDVWRLGVYTAKDVLARLRAENRTQEAQEFEKALDKAVERDCVVIVRWTGNADVDMMVEDPTDAICSFRRPKIDGSALIGEPADRFGILKEDGHTQVYACSKGFNGTYRVLIRRIWGKLTTGKITVEVYAHYRGADERVVAKKVPLDNERTIIAFTLEGGRRQEPLHDLRIANCVADQMEHNQAFLASTVNPWVRDAYARARRLIPDDIKGKGFVPVPWGSGGVGYSPIIITLPEGAALQAIAVVSADQRYVRMTSIPLFPKDAPAHVFDMSASPKASDHGGPNRRGFAALFAPADNPQ